MYFRQSCNTIQYILIATTTCFLITFFVGFLTLTKVYLLPKPKLGVWICTQGLVSRSCTLKASHFPCETCVVQILVFHYLKERFVSEHKAGSVYLVWWRKQFSIIQTELLGDSFGRCSAYRTSHNVSVNFIWHCEKYQCDIKHLWSHSFWKHDQMSWDFYTLADRSLQCFWSRNRLQEVNQTNRLMFTSLIWTLSDYTWQSLFWNWSIRQKNVRRRWDVKSFASGLDRGRSLQIQP